MAYVIRDSVGPMIKQHANDVAFKNVMLRYFPKHTTADGTIVFDRLIMWKKQYLLDYAHRKIYHQLNMNVKEFTKTKPKGVSYTYLYLKPYTGGSIGTTSDIKRYITDFSPLIYPASKDPFNSDSLANTSLNPDPYKGTAQALWDSNGFITIQIKFNPQLVQKNNGFSSSTTGFEITRTTTDSDIIAACRSASPQYIIYDPDESSRLTFIALLDEGETIFERHFRIISKDITVVEQYQSKNSLRGVIGNVASRTYLNSAIIELKFRRVKTFNSGSAAQADFIQKLLNMAEVIADYEKNISTPKKIDRTKFAALSNLFTFGSPALELNYPMNQQLATMMNYTNPSTDPAVHYGTSTTVGDYYASSIETYIRVDGLANLPPKKFKKKFLELLKTGYHEKSSGGHWYDVVVSVVIIIVTVVAIAFEIATGNAAAIGATLQATGAILAAGAIAEAGWAYYMAKNGGGTGAMSFAGKVSQTLGLLSSIVNVANLYMNWQQAMARDELIKETSKQIAAGETIDTSKQMALSASVNAVQGAVSSSVAFVQMLTAGVGVVEGLVGGKNSGMLSGVLSAAAGGYEFLASDSTNSLTEITIDSIADNIKEGVTKFFSKPLWEVMNTVVSWLNQGFNAYISLVAPNDEGLADKMAQLEKSEKELEETNIDQLPYQFITYESQYSSIFEVGDWFDNTYALTTVGRNMNLMNKYYNSGWKL